MTLRKNRRRRLISLLIFILANALLPGFVLAEPSPSPATLISAARSQIGKTVTYDGTYRKLPYPGGDVPLSTGVCTDVVIRAFRSLGFDLQSLVHEDMNLHFSQYPSRRIWGLTRPDSNIDHRRVPNLQTFFTRNGRKLPDSDIRPGDLITWELPGGLPHIGIVSDRKTSTGMQYLVIHNIGQGAAEEDILSKYKRTGHYRYEPWQ